MDAVVAEGDSIDAAIDAALATLGVTRDRVEIEILSNASRGILGFGGRKARVRARLRKPVTELAEEAAAPAVEPPPPAAPAAVPTAAAAPASPEPAPAPPPAAPPPEAAPAAAPSPAPAPAARAAAAPKPRPSRPRGAEAAGTVALDQRTVAHAVEVLQGIVSRMGVTAEVSGRVEADRIVLEVSGDLSGVLIGRRGKMLDALEFIVNRIVSRDEGTSAHILVDSESYRQRRQAALEDLARRMAAKAKEKRKPVTLEPMSPRDRRIVHLALQGDRSVTTRSSGTGFYRKVVIIPEGVARQPEGAA